MFDKNVFKDSFRVWSNNHPFASEAEAEAFCQKNIPIEAQEKFLWLREEAVAWFSWRQQNLQKELMRDAECATYQ